MQATDEWRGRLERTYLPFATWVTTASVALVTGIVCAMTATTGVLPVLIPFLCAFPAMMCARLTIAFRGFLRRDWQLLPLAACCGALTVFSLQLAYLLSIAVAMWDPGETTSALDALTDEKLTVSAFLSGSLYFLVPALLGSVASCASAGGWLYRDRRGLGGSVDGNKVAVSTLAQPHLDHDSRRTFPSRRLTPEACYFWSTTAFGPVIVSLPLALFANMVLGPGGPNGIQQLLWLMLRLYYCGTFAAAVAAFLILALVFDRRRRSAWLAALCVGVHAGALFPLLFAPAEGNPGSQVKLLLICSVLGALSAATCTAIWFPDRRGQTLGDERVEVWLTGRAVARTFLVAGLLAPLVAAFVYGLFVGVVQLAGTPSDATFIGRLRSFDLEIWAIAYKIWAVVALQALALYHVLPIADIRRPAIIVAIPLMAFLFAGAMGQSLDDYVMPKPTALSIGSFFELGLPGLVAAVVAVFLIARNPMRRPIDPRRAVA
ncbi:MAG TPA: hypothetical protein VGO04_18835 [Ensifer sp.]|uniref:hypothetical protein n=1 Tax=Ensifer sp. TaxID=1872086 RepID=UPI002E111CB7|nr:hypothetical protein [Ensifer sp.]